MELGDTNLDLLSHILRTSRHAAANHRPSSTRRCGQALTDPKVKDAFTKAGMELYPAGQDTPDIATAMLKSEVKRWGDVIRDKITAQ